MVKENLEENNLFLCGALLCEDRERKIKEKEEVKEREM